MENMSGELTNFAKKLKEKYQLNVPEDVIASVYSSKPKLPILLSRATFRPDMIRSRPEIRIQKRRGNFLRNILGVMALSVPALMWMKVAWFSPQTKVPTYVSQQASGRLLANAASIPVNQSLTFNDPTYGPFLLVHLDNGQFVAYSSICTHAGCQVQFNPYAKEITCPCHGAVFNPYNNAQVVAGPAPLPLRNIPIQYDSAKGNIYLAN
jgi:nitrite reductase/ring-hydroxylating ferredoxin subunit